MSAIQKSVAESSLTIKTSISAPYKGNSQQGSATLVYHHFGLAKKPIAKTKSVNSLIEKFKARSASFEGHLKTARSATATALYGDEVSVRTLRLKKGWSQADLAGHIGSYQSHIAKIESGRDNLALDTVLKLATAFSISSGEMCDILKKK